MKTSQCRIKRIRFKSGGEIVPLKTKDVSDFNAMLKQASLEAGDTDLLASGVFYVTNDIVYIDYRGSLFEISGALLRFQHDVQMERYTQE